MLNSAAKTSEKTNNRSNQQNHLCACSTDFFVHFLCLCFVPETSQLNVFGRKLRRCFCSGFFVLLAFIVVDVWHFSFPHRRFTFFMFSSKEMILRCLLSLALPLSLLSTSVQILKSCRKKDSTLLLFFLPKSPGGHAIYHKKARLLEMQNLTPAYMKGCK